MLQSSCGAFLPRQRARSENPKRREMCAACLKAHPLLVRHAASPSKVCLPCDRVQRATFTCRTGAGSVCPTASASRCSARGGGGGCQAQHWQARASTCLIRPVEEQSSRMPSTVRSVRRQQVITAAVAAVMLPLPLPCSRPSQLRRCKASYTRRVVEGLRRGCPSRQVSSICRRSFGRCLPECRLIHLSPSWYSRIHPCQRLI